MTPNHLVDASTFGVLERGRVTARLTRRDLWLRYLGLGGDSSPVQVDGYLEGSQTPNRREYNLLVDALNERMMDIDVSPRLAYAS